MQPLHALISSAKPKSQTLTATWNDSALAAFKCHKGSPCKRLPPVVLSHPKADAPTQCSPYLSHDGCFRHGCWCLAKGWHPISFFSRKLTPTETRYSTFDRELLAVYLAIRHFLEGTCRSFHVLTDHKPLKFALNARFDRHSPRQARQLDYISQFTSTIRGLDNTVADALSRIESNALLSGQPPSVDFAATAKTQATGPQICSL